MSDPVPRPSKDKEARIALMAMDEARLLHRDHIRSGILPMDAARNFEMQAAIAAVDHLRATGEAMIWVAEDSPLTKSSGGEGEGAS